LEDLESQISKAEADFSELDEVWKSEKAALQGTTQIKEVLLAQAPL
jgi:ATP-dependent Clp protease ATP-binding subunit ClpB